jgi:hypothetical protein
VKDSAPAEGPVPVRELLKAERPTTEPGAHDEASPPTGAAREASSVEAEPAFASTERTFEMDGADWIARPAGMGCYGTGRSGMALVQAVHFYRADAPDRPVREALLPAARLQHLAQTELRAIFSGATPIELSD